MQDYCQKENIQYLEDEKYQYILGARIKNETSVLKEKILSKRLSNGEIREIQNKDNKRLIITYSTKRAGKDKRNRERGLKRLEKNLKSGKLTKDHINNRGYNILFSKWFAPLYWALII